MRYQRVTGATLGLALMASAAPGWAADEQATPPTPDNPSYAAQVQSIPSVEKPIKGQAGASGLFEGQSLTLTTRNFYSRENMKDSFTFRIPKAGGGSQRIHQRNAWVQGTVLKYSSGYTQGSIGFGFDVAAFNEIALERGKGRIGGGGNRTLANSDGEARRSASGPSWASPTSACAPRIPNSRPVASWSTLQCSAISTTVPCPPASPASP